MYALCHENDRTTHGSRQVVAVTDCCHRPALAYLTTKRPTVEVSATPVAGPRGVDTVAVLPPLFEQKSLFRILTLQRRASRFWRLLPVLFCIPASICTEGTGFAWRESGMETTSKR